MSERKLLYRAILELAYIKECSHDPMAVTSEGAAIIREGMALLGVADLSEDEVPDAPALTPKQEAAEEMYAALKNLADKCTTYGGPKGGKMDLSQARAALAKAGRA